MGEPGVGATAEVHVQPPTPFGERVIGAIDPRTLSREEFHSSPDLLYHAAGKAFTFNQHAKVSDYPNRVSMTLGQGFYTTDSKAEADIYATASERVIAGEQAVVMEFLPYQAKMLDFRNSQDPRMNALVPVDLIKKWKQYYLDDFRKKFPPGFKTDFENLPPETQEYRRKSDYVRKLIGVGSEPLELPDLLSYPGLITGGAAGEEFSRFMLDQGYDGAIYIEGGDVPGQKNPVSYVFYNYEKIGTYDNWHADESTSS